MTERQSPNNRTTVPVLDRDGLPLAPARPSRARRWLESGRASKVWTKGIFAVQLHDLNTNVSNFALNINTGETSGITITRETDKGKHRTIVGAYEHHHRNREIKANLNRRRENRRTRRSRLRHRPARFHNRTHSKPKGWLPPSSKSLVEDHYHIQQTMQSLYPVPTSG